MTDRKTALSWELFRKAARHFAATGQLPAGLPDEVVAMVADDLERFQCHVNAAKFEVAMCRAGVP